MKCIVAVVAFAAAKASAEPAPDPAQSPGFVTIDRFDASVRAGVEASYVFLNSPTPPVGTVNETLRSYRFDFYAQRVDPETNLGAYSQLPASRLVGELGTTWSLGDLGVGGLYIARPATMLAVVVHAGATLPTSSSGYNKTLSNEVAGFARLTDFVLEIPKGISVRAGASGLVRRDRWFLRVDLGLDVNLSDKQPQPPLVQADAVLRLNLGLGVDFGIAALSLEVANIYISSPDRARETTSRLIQSAAVAVRFAAGPVRPYAALITQSDDLRFGIAGSVTAGVTGVLP
jgi:hypothetical protein